MSDVINQKANKVAGTSDAKEAREYGVVEKVVFSSHVCTVPRAGLSAPPCFPDAQRFYSGDRVWGYSESQRTLIAPVDASMRDVDEAKRCLVGCLLVKTKD